MLRLFMRAIGGRFAQVMTDAKGMLLRPRATLEEIAERDDWAVPVFLLLLLLYLGLPFMFCVQLPFSRTLVSGSTAVGRTITETRESGMTVVPGLLSVPCFIGIVALGTRKWGGKKAFCRLIRLIGYSVIPVLVMYFAMLLCCLLLWLLVDSPSWSNGLWYLWIAAACMWIAWVVFLVLRIAYCSATAAKCLGYLVLAICLINGSLSFAMGLFPTKPLQQGEGYIFYRTVHSSEQQSAVDYSVSSAEKRDAAGSHGYHCDTNIVTKTITDR